MSAHPRGTSGLSWAAGVGAAATVGASVFVLAGGAIATAGTSAILAFLFNGGIVLLSARSLAELAARLPASDGTGASVSAVLVPGGAFAVAWFVWFASIAAAAFYALGFAVLVMPILENLLLAVGYEHATWIGRRFVVLNYALGALALVARSPRKPWALGRMAMSVAMVGSLVGSLVVLTLGGVSTLIGDGVSVGDLLARFTPFFQRGVSGVVQAMGYTIIALQGVAFFAATGWGQAASERIISRTMLISATVGLVLCVPLLIVGVAVAGSELSAGSAAAHSSELFVAAAAASLLGRAGYWLVLASGSLAMLVALRVCLVVAAGLAARLAEDGTLPLRLSGEGPRPTELTNLTAVAVGLVLLALPDMSVAASLSSVSGLGAFALAHAISYRLPPARVHEPTLFGIPRHRAIPLIGGALCLSIALFQATAVPAAGFLVSLWLVVGAALHAARTDTRLCVVESDDRTWACATTAGHMARGTQDSQGPSDAGEDG